MWDLQNRSLVVVALRFKHIVDVELIESRHGLTFSSLFVALRQAHAR